ncbi:MAG: hypothetical protein DHS20C18_43050 [Saprospiraceae bacterium]|nr:MAG: hypothetical protein DHS20C18_43050 [Saprospiraceae bacterium]
MRKFYTTIFVLCFFCAPIWGQTGCPGCEIFLPPGLTADTVFISDAPSGQVGFYYDGDISFRMPMTTDPVHDLDPSIPEGFDISSITITSVANLPPGLSWEASQTEFDPTVETDGCVKFCGTPLQSGLFEVDVIVEAQVFIFTETASFSLPILIEPGTTNTEGFSIMNNSGCGTVTASFVNNIPSNAVAGYSYFWEFGNGNTSTDENPDNQLYDTPGVYEVNYQAVIDTSDYYLTQVTVTAASCDDVLGGRPDLKVNLFYPNGEHLYTADIVQNAFLPLTFDLFIPIGQGIYALQIVDDDGGIDGADDDCGTVNFTNQTTGPLSEGDLTVELVIFHPVDTILSTDTIYVYPIPEAPTISGTPVEAPCAGDVVTLTASYDERIQWYQDSLPIPGGDQPQLEVSENGIYWAVYTSEVGCTSVSAEINLSFSALPEAPVFFNENNLLTLENPGNLPEDVTIQWLWNGAAIEGANDLVYCIEMDGNYSVIVTNNETNCTNTYLLSVIYDSDFVNCTSSTGDIGINQLTIYPNPVRYRSLLSFETYELMDISLVLFDVSGRTIEQHDHHQQYGQLSYLLEMESFAAGIYFLQLKTPYGSKTFRVVKQ